MWRLGSVMFLMCILSFLNTQSLKKPRQKMTPLFVNLSQTQSKRVTSISEAGGYSGALVASTHPLEGFVLAPSCFCYMCTMIQHREGQGVSPGLARMRHISALLPCLAGYGCLYTRAHTGILPAGERIQGIQRTASCLRFHFKL